jgi:protein TonB
MKRIALILPAVLLAGCSSDIAKVPVAPPAPVIPIKTLTIPSPNNALNADVPAYSTSWPRGSDGELLSGTTTLMALVGPTGNVSDIKVELSSGSRALDNAAFNAVRRWHFSPARRNGVPIEGYVRVPVAMDGATKGAPEFYPLRTSSSSPIGLAPSGSPGNGK